MDTIQKNFNIKNNFVWIFVILIKISKFVNLCKFSTKNWKGLNFLDN